MKVAWITPWDRICGIADYSKSLWPEVQKELRARGSDGLLFSLDESSVETEGWRALVRELSGAGPDLIHFQHEYGVFGGKNPPGYWFPALVRALAQQLPEARLLATAHTVLAPDYRFSVRGRGVEAPIRAVANAALLPILRRTWGPKTWGGLDGVIVHSRLQTDIVAQAGVKSVRVIPHFVPVAAPIAGSSWAKATSASTRTVVVFGFFTPEKGQDVAIEALPHLPQSVRLVLAGGVRRKQDESYRDSCLALAERLGVRNRVEVTGFVPAGEVGQLYARADLVLAPFRETSGSGSLAQALARGAAILASDLLLNRELIERQPGCLDFFRSGDGRDCAIRIQALLDDPARIENLRLAARAYAEENRPERVATRHVDHYSDLTHGERRSGAP